MIGAILVVIAIVVVLPVSFLVGGAVLSIVTGWALKNEGEAAHEGSELIELYW